MRYAVNEEAASYLAIMCTFTAPSPACSPTLRRLAGSGLHEEAVLDTVLANLPGAVGEASAG